MSWNTIAIAMRTNRDTDPSPSKSHRSDNDILPFLVRLKIDVLVHKSSEQSVLPDRTAPKRLVPMVEDDMR